MTPPGGPPPPDPARGRIRSLARKVWQALQSLPPVLWGLIVLCLLPELVLQGADLGLWGTARWRAIAYGWGGFWPGLLQDWRPNYPGQPLAMFATYGFLHSGLSHMAGNVVTLAWIGGPLVARVGQVRMTALWAAAVIGGGIGYAALGPATVPMVGASGGLFGLAGAWAAWDYIDRFTAAEGLWPVARLVAVLVALNLFLWWAMGGQLAWETHLGGFVAGWIVALLLDPRPRVRG